jgi:hypothetical protein
MIQSSLYDSMIQSYDSMIQSYDLMIHRGVEAPEARSRAP